MLHQFIIGRSQAMANIRVKNKHRRPRASAPRTTSTILQPLAPKNVHGAEKCPNINISINTTFKIGSIAEIVTNVVFYLFACHAVLDAAPGSLMPIGTTEDCVCLFIVFTTLLLLKAQIFCIRTQGCHSL